MPLESPFLDRELFGGDTEEAAPRAAALSEWSPFGGVVLPAREAGNPLEGEGGLTGDDDRVEVGDTAAVPYRWICSITYEKDGRTLDGGTGFLISDRHVLTAGHVITNAASGPDAPTLAVYPGRHYGGEPFGRFHAVKTRVSGNNLDFGLITLNEPVDRALQWWEHRDTATQRWTEALIPPQQFARTPVSVVTAGYPGSKDSYRRRMFEARGETLPGPFEINFRHTADTTEGQSGSPIWTERGGRLVLLGIVTSYVRTHQRGLLLHEGLVHRRLRQWMAEDAPRPRATPRRIALEVPYRWVCRLEVRDEDLGRPVGHGTGVMISDRHVLTSARAIHLYARDRRRYSVRIAPGYEFGKEALGSVMAAAGRVSPGFSPDTKDAGEDYGLLTTARPLGAAVGSWGGESHGLVGTDADWTGRKARLAAFSRAAGGGAGFHRLRVAQGSFLRREGGRLLHDAGAKLDAPGAPVWVETGTRRLLVGIATSPTEACFLGAGTQRQLMEWVNADHGDRALEAEAEDPEGWLEVEEEEEDAAPELEEDARASEDEDAEAAEERDLLAAEATETEDEKERDPDEAGEEAYEEGERRRAPVPTCSAPSATTGKWLKPLGPGDLSTGCAVYVPAAALKPTQIDLLVFFHGDPGGCPATCFDPDPASKVKFGLDAQIEASGRAIALAVPRLPWSGDTLKGIKEKWSAANLDGFIAGVLAEIGGQTSVKRTLGRLILAGHSRAYNVLTPLAREFHQRVPATAGPHLKRLEEVWSLDSTYGVRHVRALDAWAAALPNGRFVAVHWASGSRLGDWKKYYRDWSLGFGPPPNLRNCVVEQGKNTHCIIPTEWVAKLLATTKASLDWCGA